MRWRKDPPLDSQVGVRRAHFKAHEFRVAQRVTRFGGICQANPLGRITLTGQVVSLQNHLSGNLTTYLPSRSIIHYYSLCNILHASNIRYPVLDMAACPRLQSLGKNTLSVSCSPRKFRPNCETKQALAGKPSALPPALLFRRVKIGTA
jgi:hypothetical protein